MFWFALLSIARVQAESYHFGDTRLYIISTAPSNEDFETRFVRDAIDVLVPIIHITHMVKRLPFCSVTPENLCACKAVPIDYNPTRDSRRYHCETLDGRRDADGNCHLSLNMAECVVWSDRRVEPDPFEWDGHEIIPLYPYNGSPGLVREGVLTYHLVCNVIGGHWCDCQYRETRGGKTSNCLEMNGAKVKIDTAMNRCLLATKFFGDGSFECFPVNDPRVSAEKVHELASSKVPRGVAELIGDLYNDNPDPIARKSKSQYAIQTHKDRGLYAFELSQLPTAMPQIIEFDGIYSVEVAWGEHDLGLNLQDRWGIKQHVSCRNSIEDDSLTLWVDYVELRRIRDFYGLDWLKKVLQRDKHDHVCWLGHPPAGYFRVHEGIPLSQTSGNQLMRLAGPIYKLFRSPLTPIARQRWLNPNTITFHVPQSPFGQTQKYKLTLDGFPSTLASCDLQGVILYMNGHADKRCSIARGPLKVKQMYHSDFCQLSIDSRRLRVLLETSGIFNNEDGICRVSPQD